MVEKEIDTNNPQNLQVNTVDNQNYIYEQLENISAEKLNQLKQSKGKEEINQELNQKDNKIAEKLGLTAIQMALVKSNLESEAIALKVTVAAVSTVKAAIDHRKESENIQVEQNEKSIEALQISSNAAKPIPSELNNKYRIEGDYKRGKYFFKESPDVVAFKDKGEKIITKSTATSVANSMVALAEAKNWNSIKLSGSDKFKQEVWMEANLRGIEVTGYKPSEQDIQNLASRQNKIEMDGAEGTKNILKTAGKSTTKDKNADLQEVTIESKTDSHPSQERSKKDELRKAYAELSRDKAIKKYPELEPLYNLEEAAKQFVDHDQNKGKFDARGKEVFVSKVRENALETLDRGEKLPIIKERTIEAPLPQEKEQDIQR